MRVGSTDITTKYYSRKSGNGNQAYNSNILKYLVIFLCSRLILHNGTLV